MYAVLVNCNVNRQKLYQTSFFEDHFYFVKYNELKEFLMFHEIDLLIIYDEEGLNVQTLKPLLSDAYQLIFYSHNYRKLYECALSSLTAYYDDENDDALMVMRYQMLRCFSCTFYFKNDGHRVHLAAHQIFYIHHQNRMSILYTPTKHYYVSDYFFHHYLSCLEGYGFLRISCYDYVNKGAIASIETDCVVLTNGVELTLTRTYKAHVKGIMKSLPLENRYKFS